MKRWSRLGVWWDGMSDDGRECGGVVVRRGINSGRVAVGWLVVGCAKIVVWWVEMIGVYCRVP